MNSSISFGLVPAADTRAGWATRVGMSAPLGSTTLARAVVLSEGKQNLQQTGNSRPSSRQGASLLSVRGGQHVERRNWHWLNQRTFRRYIAALNGLCQNLKRIAGIRWHEDRGREQSAAYPGLSAVRQTVAADERQLQPALTRSGVRLFLKCFSRAQRHGIILRSDEVEMGLLRCGQAQPRTDCTMRAEFGPLRFHHLYLDVSRFGLVHAEGALFGGHAFRRTLNVQDRSAVGKQRGKLLTLNPAYLFVVRGNAKDWNTICLTQFSHVFGIAI